VTNPQTRLPGVCQEHRTGAGLSKVGGCLLVGETLAALCVGPAECSRRQAPAER
jgi:hypothetical protein